MRKELLWAGIIGIIFGVAIGFGVYRVRNKTKPDLNATPQSSSVSGTGITKIAINKPEDLRVYTQNPIAVSGLTKPLNWVIVSIEDSDYITSSLEDGTFSIEADFDGGANCVQATSLSADGSSAFQKVLAVFSGSFEADNTTPNEATGASEIENSIAEKISQLENPPRAYIGSVTDIAESTIQIKSMDSQIQQISTLDENIAVVDTKGTTNKTVNLTDIAIGDFIVAMGYVDKNDVLSARRVLISSAINETSLNISLYKVKTAGKTSLELTAMAGSEESTLTPSKNTTIKSFSENKTKALSLANISEEDLIIVVSDNTGSPSIIRSIFVISSK